MESIVNLISTVGFPIVCCIFMWRSYSTTLKDLTAAISTLSTKIDVIINKEESDHDDIK